MLPHLQLLLWVSSQIARHCKSLILTLYTPNQSRRAALDCTSGRAAAPASSPQLVPSWQPSCEGRPAASPGPRRAAHR